MRHVHPDAAGPVGRAAASVVVSLALLLASACAGETMEAATATEPADRGSIERAVVEVLTRQQAAWNRGDIDAFMDDYARGERLRFTSGGSVRRGWQETIERYRTTYPDRAAMGRLEFSELEVSVLAERYAEVHGRWRLQRAEDSPAGLFTLLFERDESDGGWRILHDHTSSD